MRIRSYTLGPGGRLVEQQTDSTTPPPMDSSRLRWIDVGDYSDSELEEFLHGQDLQPLEERCCLEAGEDVRVIQLRESLFFEFPLEMGPRERSIFSVLCRSRLILTFRPSDLGMQDSLLARSLMDQEWSDSTAAPLVMALVALLVRRSSDQVREVRQAVAALEERMNAPSDDAIEVEVEEILESKRTASNLGGVIEDQVICIGVLKTIKLPNLDLASLADEYGFLATDLSTADRTMDRVESRLRDVQSTYELRAQDRTNRRLSTLTILSAVFMPLTFAAGIYGMNFENMPELHSAYGYPAALSLMAVIALGMLVFFRARGWFD